ncbi:MULTISPECIES: recombinase family protein [Lactonifactor]|uniref:recombinase family protein n=1 Tax=Lactonifactor TaxID=420345 RepID=UPI00325A9A85
MGYRCVDGELEIVSEQAEVVKQIFDLYLAGYTFAQIKKELEKQKIKTATGKESWDVTTIQKMLKNEKYKGDALLQKTFTEDYLHGIRKENTGQRAKYYVKGSHPAIISSEIYDEVQEEMFQRARLIVDENGARENRVEMWYENGKGKGLLRTFSDLKR